MCVKYESEKLTQDVFLISQSLRRMDSDTCPS